MLKTLHVGSKTKLVFAYVVVLILIVKQAFAGLGEWIFTQYLITYEFEFLKRGLLGQVVKSVFGDITVNNVHIFSVITLIFFSAIYIKRSSSTLKYSSLLFFLSIFSSGTIPHFIWDTGRFDVFNFLIFFGCLSLISKKRDNISFVLVTLLVSLMLLVHEASFFMFIGPIVCFWIYKEQKITVLPVLLFVSSLIITYFISTKGLLTTVPFETMYSELVVKYGQEWVNRSSLVVIHRGDLESNSLGTLSHLFSARTLFYHILFVLFLFPFIIFLFRIFKSVWQSSKIVFILLLSSFSSLALYPIGTDFFRWWSVGITVFFILIFSLISEDEVIRNNVLNVCKNSKKLLLLSIILSIAVGPLKLSKSFSISKKIESKFIQTLSWKN